MKRKLTAVLLASALVALSACDSDDDDDGNGGVETPVVDGTDGDGTDGDGTDGDGTDGDDTDGDDTDGGDSDADGGDTDGGDGDASGIVSEPGSFQVTFTNMTQGQPMTAPVVAIHDPSVHLFQIGEPASDAIQVIAEMGNNGPLVEFATANPDVVSAAGESGATPLLPGASSTITLNTEASNQVFSAVNMIICTNDGIAGVDSVELPSGSDPVVIMSLPYDAGTRDNQDDSYSFFPPPCRTRADGTMVDVVEAPLEDPRVAIGPHPGQTATPNTPAGANWDFATSDEVLMIEIVRN